MGSENGNAKTKKSSKRVKFKDEDGSGELSSECSGSRGHSREGSGSSKDSDSHLDITNRVEGTNNNDLGTNPEIMKESDNKGEVEIHKGADDESGSSKRSEVIQGEIDRSEGNKSTENINLSLASSSSSSSTDDQSQAHTKLTTSISGTSDTTSGNSSSILKQCQNGSAGSTSESQLATVTHELTVTQSPPIQVMDQQGEEFDDSSRIPSAVFEKSKSTAPTDWSYTSNDSLFSIKVGGTSFARDHILSKKVEELSKGECMALVPSPVVAPMVDTESSEYDESKETKESDDAVKDKTVLAEEPIVEKSKLANISNHSDNSGIHECSLDLPVENKTPNKSKFAWAICYCSNYSCAVCYCWNCSLKRWCCCSDSAEDGNDAPDKGKAQQKPEQQDKPLASASKSKLAFCNCCCWFPSCFRRKCC
ncbi:hypothetical protein V6N11_007937 [Hibiscus sabdariffa]|uniref:Uncharacterized protein n=1 Tax=Hibiscus sabdariffa TaxID=183260 RepID=A0ABR2PZ52_9ROSI